MAYTLIKGTLHIHYPDNPLNGPEPDGDTLKFMPNNRGLIDDLPRAGRPPKFTQTGITTIRFEGIDALETHFGVDGHQYHQKIDLALSGRDRLLELAGFGQVDYFDDKPFKVASVENHPIEGYLLSNGLDVHGRVIAFVFTGQHPNEDGSRIFVEPAMLDSSLNAEMLQEGQAYGAFYLSLPADLREHLKKIVTESRDTSTGVYGQTMATPSRPATIESPQALQRLAIWPKLFRRLAAYFQESNRDLSGLDAWLRQDPQDRDDRLLLPNQALGNMHDLIVVNGDQVHLACLPEEVVVVPDNYVLPEQYSPSNGAGHIGPGQIRIVAALINPVQLTESGHETVTIINTTDADIDLADWKIADTNGRQDLEGVLAIGETKRVQLDNRVRLSNTRDTITIRRPDGKIVDQVSYEKKDLPDEGHTKVF